MGCLPTLSQLAMKHVQINTRCPVCSEGEESIFHIMVACPFAGACWTRLFPRQQLPQVYDFGGWLGVMFEKYNQERCIEIVAVCWALWRARNDVVSNKKSSKANRVLASTKQHLLQWNFAQVNCSSVPSKYEYEGDGANTWVRP